MLEIDPTPEERREAELLARALEGGRDGANPDSVAVARLLAAVRGGTGTDEMSRRRLRNELVATASWRPRRAWALAVAAAAVLGIGLAAREAARMNGPRLASVTPSLPFLDQRESQARQAVEMLLAKSAAASVEDDPLRSAVDAQYTRRLDFVRKARLSGLLATSGGRS